MQMGSWEILLGNHFFSYRTTLIENNFPFLGAHLTQL